jgi:hypothetical protein
MRSRTRLAVAVAATLWITVAGTAPAGAAPEPDWHTVPHYPVEATLKDISVVSGDDIWSVGERQPPRESSYPLAEHWDGTSWTAVPVPDTPTGAGTLDGVGAASSADVWAVGDSNGLGPVIRHWDGRTWSAVPPAPPPGGEHPGVDRLYDVAAVSPTLAWAVGRYSNRSLPTGLTLVERWNGESWSRMPTPSPGGLDNTLRSIAAVSPTDAWAVGSAMDDQGNNAALALHWDGDAWTHSAMDLPAGHTQLMGVTAVSAHDVWAVGDNEGRPLVMHWNGSGWRMLPQPRITDAQLAASAPDGRGGVWVAGSRITDGGTVIRPLFLYWNGRRWSTGTSEEPEGTVHGLAASGASVWAVGTTSPCSCFVAPPLVEISR